MSLRISTKTTIPVGLFNKRLSILAMQGAGKTYTAGVLEEEMLDYLVSSKGTNAKLIIIDPVGAHWGIREKFPIHIIGGEKGDIQVDPDSGKHFADLIHKNNLSTLFDLSRLTQNEAIQFVTDFCERIYQVTKTPTHIIFEEADMFAPQRSTNSNQKFSLAALDSIVRRGRGRGLGCTLIAQRPAVLNKNVLTQVDASIILNITGETDLKTIREYLDSAGLSKKEIQEWIEKIMKFGKGQAMLFSPSWLGQISEINIRKRISFHSGAEPELGKPNPADTVKLVPMRIDELIEDLNQDIITIDNSIRTNQWSYDTTPAEVKEEKEPFFYTNYGVGWKIMGVGFFAIITYCLMSLFS